MFWIYTILIALSVWLQRPLGQCTVVAAIDMCGLCNTLTTLAGSVYAGTKLGNDAKKTGGLTLIAAVAAKLFAMTVLPPDVMPSIAITFVIFAMNIAAHVLEMLGI